MIFLTIESGEMVALYGEGHKKRRIVRSESDLIGFLRKLGADHVMCSSSLDWPEKGTPPRVVRLANLIRGNSLDPHNPEA